MKKLLILSIMLLIGILLNVPSYATLGKSRGSYFGVNLGYGKAGSDNGLTSNLNIGYKYSDNIGFEGGVALFPGNNYYLDGALKLIFPLRSLGYSIFGKLGVATNFKRLGPLFGLGGSYFFTPTFAGTAELTAMVGRNKKFDTMYAATLGFTWFIT